MAAGASVHFAAYKFVRRRHWKDKEYSLSQLRACVSPSERCFWIDRCDLVLYIQPAWALRVLSGRVWDVVYNRARKLHDENPSGPS